MRCHPLPIFALLAMLLPVQAWTAVVNLKITIQSQSLPEPFVIADQSVLERFNVGTGPGTNRFVPQSFIVNWEKGTLGAPSTDLKVYHVEFLTSRTGKNRYRVSYVYDAAKQQGYVFLPGENDPRYAENVYLIYRHGIEGNWFLAWSEWDDVFRQLLRNQR
jgi:hypothetical protein